MKQVRLQSEWTETSIIETACALTKMPQSDQTKGMTRVFDSCILECLIKGLIDRCFRLENQQVSGMTVCETNRIDKIYMDKK